MGDGERIQDAEGEDFIGFFLPFYRIKMNYKPLNIDSNQYCHEDHFWLWFVQCSLILVQSYLADIRHSVHICEVEFKKWLFDENQCYFPHRQYLSWANDSH